MKTSSFPRHLGQSLSMGLLLIVMSVGVLAFAVMASAGSGI